MSVDLLVAWGLFPALLFALSVGCGMLVERAAGVRLTPALLPIAGFAAIVVAGQFLTLADATAELTAPAVVALALAGIVVGVRRRDRPLDIRAPAAAAAAVFCVYAAPIVLSGEPTIAGFIKLDDTATWLTLTDRIMEHGRDLDGLAPSTYEATLDLNLGEGYPIGAFVPLGVGVALTGADPAWLIQPYIAVAAALLALALYALARPVIGSARLGALAAFVAAQPALLFGYYLWGGVKEVVAAALIAGFVALAAARPPGRGSARAVGVAAVAAAALVGVLSAGGLVWLLPGLAAMAIVGAGRIGTRATARRALVFVAVLVALALPVIVSGSLLPPTSAALTDAGARGNLIAALEPAQAAGIWPAEDFRLGPDAEPLAYALIAVACCAALAGLAWCLRRGRAGPVVYVLGTLGSCAALLIAGSPWVGAKALAIASPAIPFAAMLGIAWLASAGRQAAAAAVAVAVAGGVLWSNALGYGGVSLAPHDQLAELERIGERIAGQGPALMTEYQPYGVRHFLRDADPEGVSELRRHPVPRRDGTMVAKGGAADTDEIDPGALGYYRTLVLRRSPAQSRPPAPYRLIWRGAHYEAWQRLATASVPARRLALGGRHDPYAVPSCDRVAQLAGHGDLVAAAGTPPVIVPLARGAYPRSWSRPGARSAPVPSGAGTIEARARVRRSGVYEIWLGGSLRPEAELVVDGRPADETRHELNNLGQYVRLGSAALEAGAHRIEVRVGDGDLHPGSGGDAGPLGPLVLSATDAAESRLVTVSSAAAEDLCGRRWDWIEPAS